MWFVLVWIEDSVVEVTRGVVVVSLTAKIGFSLCRVKINKSCSTVLRCCGLFWSFIDCENANGNRTHTKLKIHRVNMMIAKTASSKFYV